GIGLHFRVRGILPAQGTRMRHFGRETTVHAEPNSGYHVAGFSGLSGLTGASGAVPTQGPDASRGYDVKEYRGLWQALFHGRQWPSLQSFGVVGPAGEEFLHATTASVAEVLSGREPDDVTTQERTRWQSVRLSVRCSSPDDVCALHHRLRQLDGVRSVV
ncbi:unnamed protein product, partial [Polarella glacialis]